MSSDCNDPGRLNIVLSLKVVIDLATSREEALAFADWEI